MMFRGSANRLSRCGWPTLAAVLACVPFLGGLSATRVFHIRDLGMYFWPRHLWLRQSVLARDWPLWDPYAGGGQSAVSDALNQFFLVPTVLIRLVAPAVIGFNLWIAVPFPLTAIGTWLWLRRRVSPAAAFVGSAVASVAGPVVSTGNFPNLSWTVVFIPWTLWSVDRLCDEPRFTRFATLAACVGLQALAGEPVTFSASCALILAYAALAMPFDRWRAWGTRLLRVGAALATGVLLSAVQIVPLLVAVSRSQRAVDVDVSYWSFHPLALVETLLPHLFGHVRHGFVHTFPWMAALNNGREPLFYSVYVGVGAASLALIGGRDATGRRWRLFWSAVCLAAMLCALGKYTVVYPSLQRVLPVLQTFRFPVKYLVPCVFALAALAASGAEVLLAHSRGAGIMRRPVGLWLFLGGIAAITGVVWVGGLVQPEWTESIWVALGRAVGLDDPDQGAEWMLQAAAPLWLRLSVVSMLIAFLVAVVWRRHRLAPLAAWTLCAVAVIDPISVNHDLHPTLPAARLGPPEWVDKTREHPLDRVYIAGRLRKGTSETERLDAPSRFPVPFEWDVQEAITLVTTQFSHTPAAWGVRELISYDLPQLWPREYMVMLGVFREATPENRLRFLRRTGMRYCFLQEPPFPGAPRLIAPALSEPMALYECYDDPRRVYITDTALVEPNLRRQLDLLFDEHHDPRASVVLEREAPAPAGDPASGVPVPAARVIRERNTELVVSAAVGPSGGYLNVMDSFDPFWRVEVDGHPAELLRANALFRAVRLPPGPHDVRFRYHPTHFYAGLSVTCITAVLLLLGCWATRRTRTI